MAECFVGWRNKGGGEAQRIAYVNKERRRAALLLGQG